MRHTLFKGEVTPFVMELPTYHLPTWQGIYLKTWDRLKSFVFKAGAVIVPMVLVLNFLNAWGIDGSFDKQNSSKSVLSEIGRSLTPAFEPMGIKAENWPATVGIFTGVMAKEAVVGTLSALYTQLATQENQDNDWQEQAFELKTAEIDAFQTIPDNLVEVADRLLDPLGLKIDTKSDAGATTGEKIAYQAMRANFDGKIGAFAYLLFVLLYAPCVAATTAIYRETSAGWAFFVVCWTTGIAYITATIFYQAMTLERHLEQSVFWIVVCLATFFAVIATLWIMGKLQRGEHYDPVRH